MPAARWYQWEQDLAQLLELLAEDDDPGIQPVEVSLAQLMAAGSDGSSLRFTSERTVRGPCDHGVWPRSAPKGAYAGVANC